MNIWKHLQDCIAQVYEKPPKEYLTTKQIVAKTGWCTDRVQNHIVKLKAKNLVETKKFMIPNINGVYTSIPHYKFLKSKKSK